MAEKPNFRKTEISLFFGDGEYPFKLPIKLLGELETLCNAGFSTIHRRLAVGTGWYVKDCIETIRLGLIGGGMTAYRAKELVDLYGEQLPKEQLWQVAMAVAGVCMVGFDPGDDAKPKTKKKAKPAPSS